MFGINIINILVSLVTAELLLNPGVPIQDSYYPSGNKEADKVYPSDRPSKKYPLLNLDKTVYDTEFNKIGPGIYSVEYFPDFNIILISDRQTIIKAPVFQVIKLSQKVHIPSAKVAFTKDNKVFIVYKNDYLEVHGFLYLPEAVLEKN